MIHRPLHGTATILATFLAVAGCAGPSPYGERYQTPIPEGSTLVLEQPLRLASGKARIFMQEGQVIRQSLLSGMDRFLPRCSFGLERTGSEPLIRQIEPDRFRTGPPHSRAHVRHWPEEGIRVAGTSLSIGFAANDRGGPSPGYLTYVIEIPLSSDRQPQVDDFTCELDRPGTWRGQLGLEAIREAAGGIVRVELAD